MVTICNQNVRLPKAPIDVLESGAFTEILGHYISVDRASQDVYILRCLAKVKDGERYVQGDFRFRHGYCKHNPRKMVKTWGEKEMRKLSRLKASVVQQRFWECWIYTKAEALSNNSTSEFTIKLSANSIWISSFELRFGSNPHLQFPNQISELFTNIQQIVCHLSTIWFQHLVTWYQQIFYHLSAIRVIGF